MKILILIGMMIAPCFAMGMEAKKTALVDEIGALATVAGQLGGVIDGFLTQVKSVVEDPAIKWDDLKLKDINQIKSRANLVAMKVWFEKLS